MEFECPNCGMECEDIYVSSDGEVEGCEECTIFCKECDDVAYWHGNVTGLCDACQIKQYKEEC